MAAIFAKILNMSLTGSLVILLVLPARRLLRWMPKGYSCVLWLVVLFRLLCPVSVSAPVSLVGLVQPAAVQGSGVTTIVEYVTDRDIAREAPTEPRGEATVETQSTQPVPGETAALSYRKTYGSGEILAALWLAGTAGMLAWGAGSSLRFRRRLVGAMKLEKNIYLADHLDSAYVTGLIFPKIYLPSDISPAQLPLLLKHEQCHIRRCDPLVRHLSYAALCIHWFNPLVWLAFLLSGRDVEMRCDEDVIRALGEDVRADYADALLSLATRRPMLTGSLLAFGEGSTKERIQNMANWNKPKKWVSALAFLLCLTILTACAANPTAPVVVSKNDGSLDIENIQSATQPEMQKEVELQKLQCTDHFQSTDGSVDITIDLDEDLSAELLPMVEVEPRYLTGSDAQRVAEVIFGADAKFYEQRPVLADKEIFSKAEIAAMLEKWQTWLDVDYMTQLYGDGETAQRDVELVKLFIDDYTARYASAPEADPRVPCQWTLKTDSVYTYDEAQLETWDTSEDCMAIKAEVEMDGIPYRFSISVRDGSDFQLNNIYANIADYYGPSTIGYDEWIAKLTRTEKPDQSQIAAIQEKAELWLAQMDLGDWAVDQCYLETHTYHDTPEYFITVTATPVLSGSAAIRQPGINTPKRKDAYASHYYMTDATFRFAPGGELIDMEISSTIDMTQVVQESVATLPMEELLEQAKTRLTLTDAASFFWSQDMLTFYEEIIGGEKINCIVTVSGANYGLVRIKAPDSDDHYYYVPALMLLGDAEYRGKDTGTVYERYSDLETSPYYLLCLNAINGSDIALGE